MASISISFDMGPTSANRLAAMTERVTRFFQRTASKIAHAKYEFTQGIANLVRWAPVIWGDFDWDWSPLARVMEYKLRRMANLHNYHGHHLNNQREARQMMICANLLNRLDKDEYFDQAYQRYDAYENLTDQQKGRYAALQATQIQKDDQRLLGTIIGKYLNHWWD